MASELLTYVMGRIPECGESIPDVARGADVEVRWLRYLAAGKIPNPGALRLEKVARYLRSKEPIAEATT